MAVKSVSIRIEQEMLDKIGYIADYEGRSVNSHILVLIRNEIQLHSRYREIYIVHKKRQNVIDTICISFPIR